MFLKVSCRFKGGVGKIFQGAAAKKLIFLIIMSRLIINEECKFRYMRIYMF